ncbi:Nucleotidyltransferase, partial [Trametes coccinea BRFM310]
AGPSHLPERPETTEVAENKPEEKRRRRPKRRHVPSQATGTEDGEAGSSVSGTTPEVYTTPWVAKLGTTAYESKEQSRLHDEIVAFYEYVSPTPDERHARAMVIAQVAEVVKRRLPKASVDPFGSVAQDLYLPDGDTDLVITTPHNYDDETKRRVLFQLAALMRNTRVTDRVQVVPRARVPLISFTTMPDLGSLKLDISMNAADGLRAVPILRNYFERLPALRYLVLVLKGLLTRHGLNTAASSGLSSYGLILLAISFLQLNPMKRPAEYIEQPLVSESLGVLLMDFLEYYADIFPYATSYVSVTQGKLLPKEDKGWANAAHPEGLCIECLLNPENDVGRPTSKIRTIRALFREAHNSLKSYPFEPNSPLPYNVLGTILAISDSTLAHRALLKDVVTSGKLGRALEEVERSGPPPGGPSRRPPPSTAQQPYPPRRYPGSGPGSASSSTRPPRGGPHTQRPPSNAGLPARPSLHPSLPARPDSSRG